MNKSKPIGIFDSGIGGLTVAQAIHNQLPNEQLIYFGDTAHLPYGDKSTAAIQSYAIKICNLLLEHDCKAIVIACNSASAAAYHLVKEYIGSKAEVFNVIDPTVEYISEKYTSQKVGIIGTRKTIESDVYANKINSLNATVEVASLATPLLAPMIEEGFYNHTISQAVIDQYLSNDQLKNIQSLVLGCTHYPLIMNDIRNYYDGKIKLLDSAILVVQSISSFLSSKELLSEKRLGEDLFYVSDYTESFNKSTKLFFTKDISLKEHKLWE